MLTVSDYEFQNGPFMTPPCPVCGSEDAVHFLEVHTLEGPLRVLRCPQCEHRFLELQPRKFDVELYEYYRKYLGKPRELRQTALNERRFVELLSTWEPQVSGRRLLDLGCGDGHMVRVANDRGWQGEGIDLSASAIELAQSWGIACRLLDFFDPTLDANRYDVIYTSEFIEHLPTPVRFIRRAEQLLAPGGLIYLTTPNFEERLTESNNPPSVTDAALAWCGVRAGGEAGRRARHTR